MEKDAWISAIREQCRSLEGLIAELESRENIEEQDWKQYDRVSRDVEKKLRSWRKMGQEHFRLGNLLYFWNLE